MNRKIASYLGFARKAGKVMSGVNTCTFGIGTGKIELVILAEDISDNSKKKIMKELRRGQVPYITHGTVQELSQTIGQSGRSVIGICDKGFAEVILKESKEVES